jgi:hypothetical protein
MSNMQQPLQRFVFFVSAWHWLAGFMFGVVFAGIQIFEWNRWPNGSALLGPLGIIWYNGLDAESLVFCVISVVLVLTFFFKPNAVTASISLFGVLNWYFWGIMAQGIGC